MGHFTENPKVGGLNLQYLSSTRKSGPRESHKKGRSQFEVGYIDWSLVFLYLECWLVLAQGFSHLIFYWSLFIIGVRLSLASWLIIEKNIMFSLYFDAVGICGHNTYPCLDRPSDGRFKPVRTVLHS
jgi:hypothetical protein